MVIVKMLFHFVLFSILLVEIRSQELEARALNVHACQTSANYRYIVSIQRDGRHTCNGVIIDERAVLTTALCVTAKLNCSTTGPNEHLKIVQILDDTPGFPRGREKCIFGGVLKCIPHRLYEKGNYFIEYDSALVILKNRLKPGIKAPLVEDKPIVKDYSEICQSGEVAGRWLDFKAIMPKAKVECFSVTVRHLQRCAEVSTHVYLRKSKNHTLTCSFDASNRYEVCTTFYGAPLICNGKVVALISHKFNFSENCTEVSPFYYSRVDWSLDLRQEYSNGTYGRTSMSIWGDDDWLFPEGDGAKSLKISKVMVFLFAMFRILTQ